jgi:hypothetical protein
VRVAVAAVPVVGVRFGFGLVSVRHPEHVPAQRDAQRGALVVAHHGQVELDLLDPGHRPRHPVHLVGQLVGARPGRHGQGQLNPHPAPPGRHLTQHAGGAERHPELRFDDGTKGRREL